MVAPESPGAEGGFENTVSRSHPDCIIQCCPGACNVPTGPRTTRLEVEEKGEPVDKIPAVLETGSPAVSWGISGGIIGI